MDDDRWEFWIDVGGTFTDVLARRPDGSVVRHKLLSSGVVKGVVGKPLLDEELILDPVRWHDPDGFWNGARLRLLDSAGQVVATTRVARFEEEGHALRLESPLSVQPNVGQSFELVVGDEAPILAI